ncbi:MAG: ribonuclease HII [Chloroflexi bacterium]|nr:ribonuclease HII [Chloroflexota bacterium]MCL5108699.1 ribonuclease HII [Chloroflexota bacterium]
MAQIPTLTHEQRLWHCGCRVVAGLDEAGRGAWAGPIVAAAVVFAPLGEVPSLLARVRDSKQLPPEARDELCGLVCQEALAVGVGMMPPELIDKMGINAANRLAMAAALDNLGLPADHLLIDYYRLHSLPTPQTPLVDGDALCFSIAAASIVAKVSRDRLLVEMETAYPGYGFAKHKGYGTAEHQLALAQLGLCPIHRRSFAPMCTLRGAELDHAPAT